MQKETDVFDVGDPFEYWCKQAYKLSGKLKISPDFIMEAMEIVKGAFGKEWLIQSFNRQSRGGVLTAIHQPKSLKDNILTPSESSIMAIYEIAVYIKRLLHIKNLDKVLVMMKSNYAQSLLQLAFGYRFLKLGGRNLEFEPIAKEGRVADIFFELDGIPYMVECYIPQEPETIDSTQILIHSRQVISRAIFSANKIVRVFIDLKQTVYSKEKIIIEKMITDAIKGTPAGEDIIIDNDIAQITISDISTMHEDNDFPVPPNPMKLYGDADLGMHLGEVPKTKEVMSQIRDGAYIYDGIRSRIFVKRPKSEKTKTSVSDRVNRLKGKLEDKLSQTRHPDLEVRRILIAEIPEGKQVVVEDSLSAKHICQKLQERIIPSHSNISSLFLCCRTWTTAFRHYYTGVLVQGKEQDCIPAELMLKLNKMERDYIWVNDWR